MKEKLFTVGTRIDEALDNRVGILAMQHRMTTAQFIKNALVDYCDKLEGRKINEDIQSNS